MSNKYQICSKRKAKIRKVLRNPIQYPRIETCLIKIHRRSRTLSKRIQMIRRCGQLIKMRFSSNWSLRLKDRSKGPEEVQMMQEHLCSKRSTKTGSLKWSINEKDAIAFGWVYMRKACMARSIAFLKIVERPILTWISWETWTKKIRRVRKEHSVMAL